MIRFSGMLTSFKERNGGRGGVVENVKTAAAQQTVFLNV